jgi:hypothetical protein
LTTVDTSLEHTGRRGRVALAVVAFLPFVLGWVVSRSVAVWLVMLAAWYEGWESGRLPGSGQRVG